MLKTLVITGSSNGLGAHVASLFTDKGWRVIEIGTVISDSGQIEAWQYDR